MARKEQSVSAVRIRSSYLSSLISISLVLFLLGLVGVLVLNAKKLSEYVKENIGFSVIIQENMRDAEILRLKKTLDARNYVKSTDHITKERAARELQQELGEDFIEFLGYNPLPVSIDVKLFANYANPDSIAVIEEDLKRFSEIKEVLYQKSLVEAINDNVRTISLVILAFTGLLFIIAIVLINNTIRLSIYSKRFIIHTMTLVGATRIFIRQPFVLKGAFSGIVGGLIATALLTGLIYVVQKEIPELTIFNDIQILGIVSGIIILIGVFINWISTFFAVNKYLNINIDKLYI